MHEVSLDICAPRFHHHYRQHRRRYTYYILKTSLTWLPYLSSSSVLASILPIDVPFLLDWPSFSSGWLKEFVDDDGISIWFVNEARRRVDANGPHSSLPRTFCCGKCGYADGTATILAIGIIAEAIWL